MVKLFYKDKVIIFDSKNNNILEKDVFFEDKPTVNFIMERINDTKSLIIRCSDVEKSFSYFQKEFQAITAAGGIVERENGDVLLIYRNDRWDLPKGKLESGETIEECAVREVMEETGIANIKTVGESISTLHFYNIYGRWELKTTHWYNMVYNGEEVVFTPQTIEGITKCEWLPKSKAKETVLSSYAAIQEVINKLIK